MTESRLYVHSSQLPVMDNAGGSPLSQNAHPKFDALNATSDEPPRGQVWLSWACALMIVRIKSYVTKRIFRGQTVRFGPSFVC